VGLVFFFEYLDNRIKSPQELRATLSVPFLGMVPAVPDQHQALITEGVPANFAESIRSIRTNVLFSSAEEGAHIVVITSAGSRRRQERRLEQPCGVAGPGGSARSADRRRHAPATGARDSSICRRSPGLSNLLVGDCKPSEAVRKWKTGARGSVSSRPA
jgi:hypothetical protein